MKSFIRNWHKPSAWYKTKQIECNGVFPLKMANGGIELRVKKIMTKAEDEQLIITLNGEEAKLFLMNMDRFVYEKENVKREQYGLSPA